MEPNSFQTYILESLNKYFPTSGTIDTYTSAWFYNFNDTEENVKSWIDDLVRAKYIENIPSESASIHLVKGIPGSHYTSSKYKITQNGRNFLNLAKAKRKLDLINEFIRSSKPDNCIISEKYCRYRREISEHLSHLKGRWKGTFIMSADDYKRLVEYTCFLVENNTLPTNVQSIPPSCIPSAFFRQTFYRLYKIYKNVNRDTWVKFLHLVFQQFTCDPETTLKKFSIYSDSSNYDSDKDLIELK